MLSTLHGWVHVILTSAWEVVATIVPILQKRRLRFRVVKPLAEYHSVRKWWFIRPKSQDYLNVLLNVRPSRIPLGTERSLVGWRPLALHPLGVSNLGVISGWGWCNLPPRQECVGGSSEPAYSDSHCLPYVAA